MNVCGLASAMKSTSRSVQVCKPGLRYGCAPERATQKRLSTKFDYIVRAVVEFSGSFGQRRLANHHQMSLETQIDSIRELAKSVRESNLQELQQHLNRDHINENLLLYALAYCCVTAEESLKLTPREGQRRAATALLMGRFVEMPTGEGKTLAIAIAAAATAICGVPVHVLTANDYLAERDAQRLEPFYSALGLTSSPVLPSMQEDARRRAYLCDVVYLTGKQAGFDWMRDALIRGPDSAQLVNKLGSLTIPKKSVRALPLQRGLCVAMLDEADSMLLDEARTPLVLAAPTKTSESQELEASTALALAQMLQAEADYVLKIDVRQASLTDAGKVKLQKLAEKVPGVWRASRYRDERVRQALAALHLWQINRDYIIRGEEIVLVDEQTGRALPDRRLQHGLHGMLESKERCQPTPEHETIASIAFQSFFLKYMQLVGTSATLSEVRGELCKVYQTSLVRIAPACKSQLVTLPARVFESRALQFDALIEDVRGALSDNRPVLIGTRSVEQSRGVSGMLRVHDITHSVLDASQSVDEAALVASAGVAGCVTIATNMAGRGTDIPLGEGVAERGGLHLVSLAFNDERRFDRQLVGRTARQGDRGSFRQIWTLDDPEILGALPASVLSTAQYLVGTAIHPSVAQKIVLKLICFAQRRIEWRHALQRQMAFATRKRLASHVALDGNSEHPV